MFSLSVILAVSLLAAALVIRRLRRELSNAEQRRHAELLAQRERYEAEQSEHRTRVEAMLDAMIEGLIMIDSERRIMLANRAAETMFGFSRMMAGGTLLEAVRNHEVAAVARRALVESAPIEQEVRLESPSPRVLQVSAVSLNATARTSGAVLVFHDVTRLRQLEAMRQDFVANVSHELRTPLSLIKSAAETLIGGGKRDPAVTTRFLEIIDKHASRLTVLIDDLLLLAHLDSGRIELDLHRVGVRALVQDVLDDAALLAGDRRVVLKNEVGPEIAVEADLTRLRQVLGNLVQNAIKYGKIDGSVLVVARRVGGGMTEIQVRDDGPGIPAEALERVFERFYRVDKARSREQGGTGLGLAIVKNLVQAHGGAVRAESTPGKGATFCFTVPSASA